MREFFVEFLLPFTSVCAVIVGATVALFDVRNTPPPAASAGPPPVQLTPAEIPDTTSRPAPTAPRREQINDVLSRAVRALAESGPAPVATTGASTALATAGTTAPADPRIAGLTSKLAEAVRIARDARDDKDLARAEELMRAARQDMDAVCDKGGGPLCESAGQIRQLGY